MHVRSAWLLLPACLLSACTSTSYSQQPTVGTSWTTQSVVVSVGHSPRSTDPPPRRPDIRADIDLRRVVLRTGPRDVVATFTTYNRMHLAWMRSPTACGQVGIYFDAQHLTMSSSPRTETDYGDTAVAHDRVHVRFLTHHLVRLTVPRAALGTDFSASESWVGYSLGTVCPPGGQQEDNTGTVTPET